MISVTAVVWKAPAFYIVRLSQTQSGLNLETNTRMKEIIGTEKLIELAEINRNIH